MHPEAHTKHATNYGSHSGTSALLFLIWAVTLIPGIFLGRYAQPGLLTMMVTTYQVVPRCLYPVSQNWSVLLRRIFAATSLIVLLGAFSHNQLGLWTRMTVLFSLLLFLDLYDHWLLNYLLGIDFTEGSHK
jgi:hypothetical protein